MLKKEIILKLILTLSVLTFSGKMSAQTFVLGTDVLEWANLGTVNVNAGASLARHFSAEIGGRYNPWTFHNEKNARMIRNQQITAYAGAKYWPWYVFSGWWIEAKVQFSKYSQTGIWRYALDEGKAIGGGLSFGYTLMLTKKMNIEFGAGFWGGKKLDYVLYHCPNCMMIREQGSEFFFDLDNISISLIFVL